MRQQEQEQEQEQEQREQQEREQLKSVVPSEIRLRHFAELVPQGDKHTRCSIPEIAPGCRLHRCQRQLGGGRFRPA
ncbi:hypothetical protein C7B61_09585 [filamentous cyanobacterium CCP1]|nr:hypothetical protein C7B76_02185 [filamentous cyanobacterium CCP2]PSB66783.1 hypothetical protein C7B61_09585 [filamentous cyanobacterium CCP1]